VPVLGISQAVRVEADGLIILCCSGGGRIIRRPVQFDHVYSKTTGLVAQRRLRESAALYAEVYEEDDETQEWTDAGLPEWPT
jgi:hypothetical protein